MRLLRLLILATLVALPHAAYAAGQCVPVTINEVGETTFTTEDISGGTVTSGIFSVSTAANLTLRFDLVDASDEITNVRVTFREYSTNISSPQARVAPDCDKVAGVWTCNRLAIDWNPTTSGNGKNWVMPIPVAYKYMDFVVTTTGHGAGDTLTVTGEVCY